MNLVERPPIDANGVARSDDLDEVLRAFFRSEMPQPWPPLQRPQRERRTLPFPPPALRRRWFPSSRLALAASVGLLVIGHFFLSDTLQPAAPNGPGLPEDSKATREPVPGGMHRTMPRRTSVPPPQPGQPGKTDGTSQKGKDAYRTFESLIQDGDKPTELRIVIIPNM
jgi:hypothetical protein